jgi:hypothetical protein
MKRLPMLVVVLVTIVAVAGCGAAREDTRGTTLDTGATTILSSSTFETSGATAATATSTTVVLDSGRVIILCDLSDETPQVTMYELQPEQVDLAAIAARILTPPVRTRDGDRGTCYYDSVYDLVRREASGEVTLSREIADLPAQSALTPEAVEAAAGAFIDDAGGLPQGYAVSSAANGTVEYRATIDSRPVINACRIGVTVGSKGVYHYVRFAPEVSPQGGARAVLSSRAAVEKAASRLVVALQRGIHVNRVKLVYWGPTPSDMERSGERTLRPAYEIRAEETSVPFIVDALDASVLSAVD